MNSADELVKQIKIAAVEAVNAEKPAAVCWGRVISGYPLKITVDQKLILGEHQLILTEGMMLNGKLAEGDKVVLLRAEGGQEFVVIDRIYSYKDGDEI